MNRKRCLAIGGLIMAALLWAAALTPAYALSRQDEGGFAQVDTYVETQMETLNIPGLALAIVQGDQIAYVKGYGEADPNGRAVTPQTPFLLGSISKSITALATMQLVEAGAIDLDTPVQTYLPWFRAADPASSAQITVRHLLHQTSGFSNATGLQEFASSDLSDNAIESSVRRLEDEELSHTPGTTHEYSNANYVILGLIVQTVSGQSYESYVRENVFEPLEMDHSHTSQAEAEQDGMVTGYVTWFRIPFAKDVAYNRGSLPSGYLICSAEDMAHLLIAQINGGRFGDRSVLSPDGVAEMHRPAVPTDSPDTSYGMGWYIGPTNDLPTIYHGGDVANGATAMVVVPEDELGVLVMINTNGTFIAGVARQIVTGVMSAAMGGQPEPYESPQELTMVAGSVIVPAIVSALWIAWTVFRFVRRRRRGDARKHSALWIVWVVALPLLVDVGLLLILLVGIPTLWGLPMAGLILMFPDMAMLIFGSALGLAGWGIARTVLTLSRGKAGSLPVEVPGREATAANLSP